MVDYSLIRESCSAYQTNNEDCMNIECSIEQGQRKTSMRGGSEEMRGEQRWNTKRTMGTKGIKLRAEKKCNERNYLDGRLMRMKEVRMQGAHARAAPRTQTCARSPAHATCLSNNTTT